MCYSNFVPKTYCFWDIRLDLETRVRVTQGHRNRHGLIRPLWFPINVSEINGDFSRKSQNYPPPCISLGIWYRRWGQKLEWWGYRAEKEVWRYLQPCGNNRPMWQTDGQTETGRQQRPRLCSVVVSRSKNGEFCVEVGAATRAASIHCGLKTLAVNLS